MQSEAGVVPSMFGKATDEGRGNGGNGHGRGGGGGKGGGSKRPRLAPRFCLRLPALVHRRMACEVATIPSGRSSCTAAAV